MDIQLELHKQYNFDTISELAQEHNLMERDDVGMLVLFGTNVDVAGEIGEITMPAYFKDDTVACNFILTGHGTQSQWRCVFVSKKLSKNNVDEI